MSADDAVTTAATEYTVKAGDFLAGIAAKVGVGLPALLSANNMTAKSLILPGDKLAVPAGATVVAAAPAASAVAASPAAGAIVYTVKAGDSLYAIATAYKVKLADLLATTKLSVTSIIQPGMQLALPANAVAPQAGAAPAAAPAANLTYTIQSGDFLARIAAKYKVTLSALLAANQLKATSLILPGATLTLPVGAIASDLAAGSAAAAIPGPAGVVVAYAYAQLGKPYRFFTDGPSTFDCSGLVRAAYAQIGMDLVHHAASQATYGTPVDIWSQPLKPGDLVFLTGRGHTEISHVGIVVDATHWIHAPAPGDVVRLGPIPAKGIVTTVRRLIP